MNAQLPVVFSLSLAISVLSGCAQTSTLPAGQSDHTEIPHTRVTIAPTPSAVPASKPATSPTPAAGGRGSKPLHAVTGVAPGQTGYVHYFLLRMPDETLEVQVGIELADQRIAWSFPDLGVVISPFINGEILQTGDKSYSVWHLYGVKPFPDEAAMTRLQKDLPGRIAPWIKAQTPYCLDDGPKSNCMSCLGFVMRALFPGRSSDYPAMPRDFSRTIHPARYTPNDLLLYLTGMLDLPDRNTRIQRIARHSLPADLREDLEELVRGMGAGDAAPVTARQKRIGGSPARNATPKSPRSKPSS